jgi:putative ubiquitin-RnfH superfamily antitoxin RatB of RatAB toxin-antitoxin module
MAERLHVEVAAGLPGRQVVIELDVPAGTTAISAVRQADLQRLLPGVEVDESLIGIFGKRCRPDQVLADGDRVEVYRPLKADPKEVRRQLAELERSRRKT